MNDEIDNQACGCSDYTFGTLDEILSVSCHTTKCQGGLQQFSTRDMNAKVNITTS